MQTAQTRLEAAVSELTKVATLTLNTLYYGFPIIDRANSRLGSSGGAIDRVNASTDFITSYTHGLANNAFLGLRGESSEGGKLG